MKLHHSLLKLTRLVRGKAEVTNIVWAMFLWLIVSQFSLDSVGAQKGVGDKRAGETTRQDVVPQLQAQVVPDKTQRLCQKTSGRVSTTHAQPCYSIYVSWCIQCANAKQN